MPSKASPNIIFVTKYLEAILTVYTKAICNINVYLTGFQSLISFCFCRKQSVLLSLGWEKCTNIVASLNKGVPVHTSPAEKDWQKVWWTDRQTNQQTTEKFPPSCQSDDTRILSQHFKLHYVYTKALCNINGYGCLSSVWFLFLLDNVYVVLAPYGNLWMLTFVIVVQAIHTLLKVQ